MHSLHPIDRPQQNAAAARKSRVVARPLLVSALALALASVPGAALAEDASQTIAAEQLQDRDTVLDLLSRLHVSGTPRSALEKLTVPGMIEALHDPYTVYFDKSELQNFNNYIEQSYVASARSSA
ncbi:hypothetical protein [Gordoniibacillus kamchatkensis]|uniref:hypothetical protein n=1 Tax=Gordoniibacillus kamchatkensis TaxID=1590651 RepID=UPI000695F45B|nr:hypothetical protein [Paenibacillus sp. VKM B-2647]